MPKSHPEYERGFTDGYNAGLASPFNETAQQSQVAASQPETTREQMVEKLHRHPTVQEFFWLVRRATRRTILRSH